MVFPMTDPQHLLSLPWIFVNFLEGTLASFGSGQGIFATVANTYVVPGLLTTSAFSLSIVLGQVTPGPVSVAAVGMGFLLAGPLGAVLALAAALVPMSIFAVLASHPHMEEPTRRFVGAAQPVVRWLVPCLSGYIVYGLLRHQMYASMITILSCVVAVVTLMLGLRRSWEPSRAILVGLVASVLLYSVINYG